MCVCVCVCVIYNIEKERVDRGRERLIERGVLCV